ncbi:MAG: hypothetical protein EAX95_05770 [Candidatus Thorarchaeota archaeon]|nr:hypothetical protein [Candidatus Thorarchaeota archaeon]
MSGREVASIVWTAISGSTKLLAKTTASVLSGKMRVRSAKSTFKKRLKTYGLPVEMVEDLAVLYALPGKQMLSIRYLIGLLRQIRDEESTTADSIFDVISEAKSGG